MKHWIRICWRCWAGMVLLWAVFPGVAQTLAPTVAAPTPADAAAPAADVAAPAAATAKPEAPAKDESAPGLGSKDVSGLITMTVSEAKIQDVLRSLAAMRPKTNIILAPEVQGNVSFALRDVTWDTALKLIAESQGFVVTQEGPNLFRVHKPKAHKKATIEVQILTAEDVGALSDAQIAKMLPPPPPGQARTPEEARKQLLDIVGNYLRRLSVDDQPAAEVVKAIARAANLNYSFSPTLQGANAPGAQQDQKGEGEKSAQPAQPVNVMISLNLEYIAIADALNLVANQGNLSCEEKNGVWVIQPKPPKRNQQEPLVLETIEVQYIPVDQALVELCKGLVSKRGSVAAGMNRILIVQDTKTGIEAVKKAVTAMDVPTPQVLIEARFFEINKSDSKHTGIDWNALGAEGVAISTTPLSITKTDTVSRTKTTSLGTSSGSDSTTNTVSTDLATGAVTGTLETVSSSLTGKPGVTEATRAHTNQTAKSAILNVSQFSAVLHALLSNTSAKQLSNPKIVVTSEHQATIHIGPQTPIFKSSIDTTSSGSVRTYELDEAFGGETVEELELVPQQGGKKGRGGKMRKYTTPKGYLDLGTKLTVAPSVKSPEEIYIRVVPELISVTSYEAVGTGDSAVRYPVLFTTRVNTEFSIHSGQTIAIGGLVSHRTKTTENKIPLLGDVPGLGRLFRYQGKEKEEAETIIFLTVKIVPSEEMNTTGAVPTTAYLVQSEIERIEREDSEGAEYSQERARQKLREVVEQAKRDKWSPAKLRKQLKSILQRTRFTPAPDTAEALPPPAVVVPVTPESPEPPTKATGSDAE
ncbi:MAG: hypothetical protein GXP31_12910 [Kiritimatiellaeota bacterium]|nr:hypothetical protein [Kiritimatiellota bacterium]